MFQSSKFRNITLQNQEEENSDQKSYSDLPTSESDDSFDEEEMAQFNAKLKSLNNTLENRVRSRTSVSAETFEIDENFQAPVYEKSEAVKETLFGILNEIFMFQFLEMEEKNVIIGALKRVEVEEGEFIIEQGADGFELFVVTSGTLEY